MGYHINSKLTYIFILLICSFFYSCSDIVDTEKKIGKDLLPMSPTDSLKQLVLENIDFGDVTYNSISLDSILIENKSMVDSITIYNITTTDQSGLFTYIYPWGLPFKIAPNENTLFGGRIIVRFFAQSLYFKEYTDTLIINNNDNFRIAIRAYIRSF